MNGVGGWCEAEEECCGVSERDPDVVRYGVAAVAVEGLLYGVGQELGDGGGWGVDGLEVVGWGLGDGVGRVDGCPQGGEVVFESGDVVGSGVCLPVMWGADGNEVVVDDGGVRVLAE